MSRRLRMTVVYDFSWALDEVTEEHADRLVQNFLADPRGFMNLEFPEWDEQVVVAVEDITENSDG